MSIEANKAVVRRYFESWNKNDIEMLDSVLSFNVIDHTASPNQPTGREGFHAFYRTWHLAFPGFVAEIDDMIAEAHRVATRWTFRGRHLGVYNGIAPTGLDVAFSAVSIEYIQDSLITDEWFIGDMHEMMERLLTADRS